MSDGQPPAQFWRAANGEPDPNKHLAPPSIMQIKISQMLDEQASEQAEDSPEAEEPADAAAPDQARAPSDPAPDDLPAIGSAASEKDPEPQSSPEGDALKPAREGYEQAANFSRSAVLSTLP
ncbi:hypothetical protein [Tropicibacter oceani]|uniref:Uncharacterized protein n=1 Tax=Tropicibacter oceani TaxID=3058420 RepID=A0ABY8QI14_9RHOB|nr:hypothetical protein [Tropicibacter oceani]WGW03797.1 hypothetical protein QF118_18065 [Tropicibacter oceani]